MRVTAISHPTLFEAFETISHDSGGRAGHDYYEVPEPYSNEVDKVEKALKELNADDLQTFCIGEQSEGDAIAKRSPELMDTTRFLNAFFGNWQTE